MLTVGCRQWSRIGERVMLGMRQNLMYMPGLCLPLRQPCNNDAYQPSPRNLDIPPV